MATIEILPYLLYNRSKLKRLDLLNKSSMAKMLGELT